MLLEHHAGGFDRHQPSGQEQQVEGSVGVRHGKASGLIYRDGEVYPSVLLDGSL
jgi:hypothetical protein